MRAWRIRFTALVAAFTVGLAVGAMARQDRPAADRPKDDRPAERVTGIGGIFFKAKDTKALGAWYRDHLGLAGRREAPQMSVFEWREREDDKRLGSTAWALFRQDTKYFAPSQAPFMVDYRVRNLDRMIAQLRAQGVAVEDKIVDDSNGRFAWLMDPEGNRIELWEPKEGN